MTGPAPLEYGEFYHIYDRGNNRENIFIERRNYRHFLRLYVKHVEPVADTYAYCLMRNHFHLLVRIKTVEEQETQTPGVPETPRVAAPFEPRIPSRQFGHLFNAYAKAINKAYQRSGSLFEHPFGRVHVSSDAHFVHLIAYIHQNPQKHGFVDDFRDWPYSSYRAIISSQPTRLLRDEVLAWFGSPEAYTIAHQSAVSVAQVEPLVPDDFW
jgi:REP element-mobilizing transposase RayT